MSRPLIRSDADAFVKKNRSIIYGTMLGDATVPSPSGKNTSMQFCHSGPQKEYLFYKYELFKEVAYAPTLVIHGDKKQYSSWRFHTAKHKAWQIIWSIFHEGSEKRTRAGRTYIPKIVNQRILDVLDDHGVALWWMDDGFVSFQHNDETGWWNEFARLSTCDFTFEENELIAKWFLDQYGATATVQRQKSERNKDSIYPVLNFSWQEFLKIKARIDKFIIPSMVYKTDIKAMQFWMSKRLLEPHGMKFDGESILRLK